MSIAKPLIEDILGDFGFRVRWRATSSRASFEVFQVISAQTGGPKLFEGSGSSGPAEDMREDIDQAEPYLTGDMRWDGQAYMVWNESNLYGSSDFQSHVDLLHYLYVRSFELMGREPEDRWEEAETAGAIPVIRPEPQP